MNDPEAPKNSAKLHHRPQAGSYIRPEKGHTALRKGRISSPNEHYFLTLCTTTRGRGLEYPPITQQILSTALTLNADLSWRFRCGVVMPDHVHLLVALGKRLTLGQTVGRLKAKTSSALRARQLEWEHDFFDHHLRPKEDRIDVFLYIYLNPYRAHVCDRTETWPGFFCCAEDWRWFHTCLDQERPHPSWL